MPFGAPQGFALPLSYHGMFCLLWRAASLAASVSPQAPIMVANYFEFEKIGGFLYNDGSSTATTAVRCAWD